MVKRTAGLLGEIESYNVVNDPDKEINETKIIHLLMVLQIRFLKYQIQSIMLIKFFMDLCL